MLQALSWILYVEVNAIACAVNEWNYRQTTSNQAMVRAKKRVTLEFYNEKSNRSKENSYAFFSTWPLICTCRR